MKLVSQFVLAFLYRRGGEQDWILTYGSLDSDAVCVTCVYITRSWRAWQHNSMSTILTGRTSYVLMIDPLLTKHRCLLDVNFGELCDGPTLDRQYWVTSMESAVSSADYVRSGRRVSGNLGTFLPTTNSRHTLLHTSRSPSNVCRQRCWR